MKRMVIERYVPPAEREPSDGLPPLPPLPPADGKMQGTFIGRRHFFDGWGAETMDKRAKQYARTCMAAQDLEIDALKVERDALKTRLDELEGR